MPAGPTPPEHRLRIIAAAALGTILAWAYVIHVAGTAAMSVGGNAMAGMDMTPPAPGAAAPFLGLFAMWAAMMVGMMLPSVLPNVLLYSALARQRRERDGPPLSVSAFVGGYLAIWVAFSLVAAVVQTRLRVALLPEAQGSRAAAIAAGVILLVTGIYQWTRFKVSCLSHCRSPIAHFSAHWREGTLGAWRMGLEHGFVCLGCCWLLMGLLFVGGVMNPWWVGGLALLVLLEKVVPHGDTLGKVAGTGLAVWGVVLLLR